METSLTSEECHWNLNWKFVRSLYRSVSALVSNEGESVLHVCSMFE